MISSSGEGMGEAFNVELLPHRELEGRSGEKFSLTAIVSDLFGFKDVLVHHDAIPPGRRASSPHAHSLKEEMVFVIEGFPTAVVNDEEKDLRPGDCFGFQPSRSDFHFLENRTQSPVRVLVISSAPAGDEAIYRKPDDLIT